MASIPKTMKGVLIEKTGGVEVLQYKTDLPVPTPKEGEVLVKNDFIGINYIDTYFRTGLYPAPKPEILGREAEGTILSTGPSGNLYNLKPNDRVVWLGTGAYAEYSAVPASKAVLIPSALPAGIAAASLLQGLTALTMIRESYHVQKGEWILVHAAAGGVGLWLCQLLRVVGARTIGTASTVEKLELAKANGAEVVINYKTETDLDQFENDLEVVARKGTIVSFGNSSGAVPPFSISRLTAKNIKLMRPTLFHYIATREEYEGYCAELFDFIIKDKLNTRIHETYPLADIARAHTDLEGRKTTGKLLLKP
ncbi:putative quinone oxidoreductase [Lachnellula subtilissima]|uniref:Putative quinone oxidoreductase n=1 Tax=Lachnellula subtilissima TaxID=602034 RepID=A0A8H8U9I9_9HELO|nr:putative quinone oxidoreductase [Lachnellula subtilissima]